MNKKAEIPVVILVLGVLLLCILLFVSFEFFSSGGKNNAGLKEIVMVEQCSSYIEQYHFYNNIGLDIEEIKKIPSFKDFIDSENFLVCKSASIEIKVPLN